LGTDPSPFALLLKTPLLLVALKYLQMNNFNTGILYINGGGNGAGTPSKIDPIVEILCVSSGTVAANLDQIPNQPCVFATDPLQKKRSEDAFIAFTWFGKTVSTHTRVLLTLFFVLRLAQVPLP
jgi:hypothetical protein